MRLLIKLSTNIFTVKTERFEGFRKIEVSALKNFEFIFSGSSHKAVKKINRHKLTQVIGLQNGLMHLIKSIRFKLIFFNHRYVSRGLERNKPTCIQDVSFYSFLFNFDCSR